jgi:hypothetical protein
MTPSLAGHAGIVCGQGGSLSNLSWAPWQTGTQDAFLPLRKAAVFAILAVPQEMKACGNQPC